MRDNATWHKTQDFYDCFGELQPLVKTLPMMIFNLEAIVSTLLRYVNIAHATSKKPILNLIGALARDVRSELAPHFANIFTSVAQVLSSAADAGELETVEQAFQCIAYLLKYLSRDVGSDLPSYLANYSMLFRHPQDYVRLFAGETLSFTLRRLRPCNLEDGLCHILALLEEDR